MQETKIDQSAKNQDSAHSPYKGGSKEFDGDVTLQRIVTAGDSDEVEVLAVWFAKGARNRPHTHSTDQVLHIVEGRGIVADEKEKRVVSAGDVVTVRANAWHWHGATSDSAMMHMSIRKAGATTNWDVDQKDWAHAYDDLKK